MQDLSLKGDGEEVNEFLRVSATSDQESRLGLSRQREPHRDPLPHLHHSHHHFDHHYCQLFFIF